jgi:Gpi18-like mannosyltransferase
MTFGADGVSSFQGTKLSVIKKIVDGWVPHSMGCIVWLIEPHLVQILSHLQMMNIIEIFFQITYNFFPKALKNIWNL